MVFVDQVPVDAVDIYADALSATADALMAGSIASAREQLEPIAGELWRVRVATAKGTASPDGVKPLRNTSDATRASVFARDAFRCSRCGGRGLARCVLVAISDVFPDAFAYDPHYGRDKIHPAYWVLALEADHTIPHAKGGTGDAANLSAMHAFCNTSKADVDVVDLPTIELLRERTDWDGLLAAYPAIVAAGEQSGHRHSRPDYHRYWLRQFGIQNITAPSDSAGSNT